MFRFGRVLFHVISSIDLRHDHYDFWNLVLGTLAFDMCSIENEFKFHLPSPVLHSLILYVQKGPEEETIE